MYNLSERFSKLNHTNLLNQLLNLIIDIEINKHTLYENINNLYFFR